MRNRFNNQLSSVNESTSLLKSKLLFRPSKRRRSWISKQSFPSRKQSGFASFFSSGGGGAVDFASSSGWRPKPGRAQRQATTRSKPGIIRIIFWLIFMVIFIKELKIEQ